jgi:hypothetical protein
MFEIRPIGKQAPEWPHDEIPSLPFRMLITAPSGSGKSTIVANILQWPPYRKAFKKNVFVFSPTFRGDPVYANSGIDSVWDGYDEAVLSQILEEQKRAKRPGKKLEHVLIILDDLVCQLPSAQKNFVSHLYMTGRHYNISLIVCTQSYKMISRGVRMNATCMVCLHVNAGERKKMAEESAASNFEALLADCTSKPYGFLVEVTSKPLAHRFRRGFSTDYLDAK